MTSIQQIMRTRNKRTTMSLFEEDSYEHPALCIPRGLGQINHQELTTIINRTGLGEIYKIIIKPRSFTLPEWERVTTPPPPPAVTAPTPTRPEDAHKVFYNNIYIYFKKWNTENPTVRKYRNNLMNGQSIKIVHNTIPTPIFWRCVAANFHKRR